MNHWQRLPIATRVHTVRTRQPQSARHRKRGEGDWRQTWPDLALVLDCETTTDPSQRLTFGAYRVLDGETLVEEGLFVADDLPARDRATVEETASAGPLRVLDRESFLREVFFPVAHGARGVVVGFNLPFDLARLACDAGLARGKYKGGFSFTYLTYVDEEGVERPDKLVPRIAVKALDSKRARIGFTSSWRKYEKRQSWANLHHAVWRGCFVDLRTLTFALTGAGQSLDSACKAFGIEAGKLDVEEHGKVTLGYVDYARHDVRSTARLYRRALAEYARHPIALPPDRAYSPASIGKAYLRAMGVRLPKLDPDPPLELSADEVHGFAMEAYYGGRAECRVRKVPVPVAYCDFRSMYPTVNTLMGLWRALTAQRLRVIDATDWARQFLARVTPDDLFRPETWRDLAVLVECVPAGNILPARAPYTGDSEPLTIGVNPLTVTEDVGTVWYTLADCVADQLAGRKPLTIRRAIRFVPGGRQRALVPVALRGQVAIDPAKDDFFREVIRARGRVKADPTLPEPERNALQLFLKILANATSYGVFVELNRQDGETAEVEVFGGERFATKVEAPEEPGDCYFPPLAALITGGARLMLALAETEVARRGGAHAFMDTDSIAIVASEHGGLVPCLGGLQRLPDGRAAIRALSWAEVEEVRARFIALDPYGDGGEVLELEGENRGEDERQRELWCLAIAAKRYALFTLDGDGVRIAKATEHGLGAYLVPNDPASGKRVLDWIDCAWTDIVRGVLTLPTLPMPAWAEQLATTRLAISTPHMLGWFKRWNAVNAKKPNGAQRPYGERVKPFGFLHHAPLDQTIGGARRSMRTSKHNLVAPYGDHCRWINLREPDGEPFRLVTYQPSSGDLQVLVGRTYNDLIAMHPFHPEPKSLGADSAPCHERTVGLLTRRPIVAIKRLHVGKEANELERVEAGLVDEVEQVLNVYEQDRREELREQLRSMSVKEGMAFTRYSRRQVFYMRASHRKPSRK
jgi:hypothetical protein